MDIIEAMEARKKCRICGEEIDDNGDYKYQICFYCILSEEQAEMEIIGDLY